MSDGKTYEMLWDCKFCGTTKLLGKTHRFCPNCGAAQDDEARYFPSDEEKVAVEDHVYHGADLICANCETLNSAAADFCQQCGSPLENAQRAELVQDDQVIGEGGAFASTGARNIEQERYAEKMAAAGLTADGQAQSSGGGIRRYAIIGVVVLVLGAIGFFLFSEQDTSAYVTGHSWTRTIEIERFEAREDSAWCDAMPADAYSITRREEQRSSRQIPDGETCTTRRVDNGDGTFTERRECQPKYREEPIYDDRCYFTVDRWGVERQVSSEGDSLGGVEWPQLNLSRTGECLGCEREGSQDETYTVHFREGDREYSCEVSLEQWQNMPIESRWTFQVNRLGGVDCNNLEPAS